MWLCKSKCKDMESLTSTGASGRHEAWRLLTVNDCTQLNVFYTTEEVVRTRNECSLFNALCLTDLSIQNHNKHIDHTADGIAVFLLTRPTTLLGHSFTVVRSCRRVCEQWQTLTIMIPDNNGGKFTLEELVIIQVYLF